MLALSGFAHASDLEVQPLSCTPVGNDAMLFHASRQDKPVQLKGRGDVCEAGLEYIPAPGQTLTGIVLAAPTELGLRAKTDVYHISFQDGSAVRIGDLPASSERTVAWRFVDVFQEGEAVFLDRYDVTPSLVKRRPVSLELMFDGRLCVQHKDNVWNMETGEKRTCSKIVGASFANPLCIIHETGKARLGPRLACKELEDKWRFR